MASEGGGEPRGGEVQEAKGRKHFKEEGVISCVQCCGQDEGTGFFFCLFVF